jgi:hypothetical protein
MSLMTMWSSSSMSELAMHLDSWHEERALATKTLIFLRDEHN